MALLVLSSVLIGAVWPLVLQQFVVEPNGIDREPESIPRNIDATRAAYAIPGHHHVHRLPGPVGGRPADGHQRPETRCRTPGCSTRTCSRDVHPAQQRRNFYGFPEQAGHGPVHGQREDAGLRRRRPRAERRRPQRRAEELDQRAHGVHPRRRLVAAPANLVNARWTTPAADRAACRGSRASTPATRDDSIPDSLKVKEPRTYYGQLTTDYAIVGAESGAAPREYDTDTQRYTYTGAGGVPVGNLFNRAGVRDRVQEPNFLFIRRDQRQLEDHVQPEPGDRVQKAAAPS